MTSVVPAEVILDDDDDVKAAKAAQHTLQGEWHHAHCTLVVAPCTLHPCSGTMHIARDIQRGAVVASNSMCK